MINIPKKKKTPKICIIDFIKIGGLLTKGNCSTYFPISNFVINLRRVKNICKHFSDDRVQAEILDRFKLEPHLHEYRARDGVA